MQELLEDYMQKRHEIETRLEDFSRKRSDEALFYELCYCVMTANGSAEVAMEAQKFLEKNDYWKNGDIGNCLSKVRFAAKKCVFISSNRKNILQDNFSLSDILEQGEFEAREFIIKDKNLKSKSHFKGLGYKEASHFLRNIGFGNSLAILDRHILKNLVKYGVIAGIPKSLTKNRYLEIEQKMKEFSGKIGIPLSHLDLLFWSRETGKILK